MDILLMRNGCVWPWRTLLWDRFAIPSGKYEGYVSEMTVGKLRGSHRLWVDAGGATVDFHYYQLGCVVSTIQPSLVQVTDDSGTCCIHLWPVRYMLPPPPTWDIGWAKCYSFRSPWTDKIETHLGTYAALSVASQYNTIQYSFRYDVINTEFG